LWIIPKNLRTSLSVLDTEALTSDSEELSELFAQSLLARSKPSPAKTWLRRLKQGSLTLLPFGRILKPSLGERFVDQWTSSLEASLANPSAPLVSVEETMTQDTFGPTSCGALESLDTLPLFSLRTSRGSSAQSSQATSGATPQERPFCTMSSVSWKDWVTAQRQEYSARAKLASPINANVYSSWALDATSHTISVSGCHRSLEQEMKMWATMRVGASNTPAGGGDPTKEWHKNRIEKQVQTWLTPAATANGAQESLYTATGEPWEGEGRAYRENGVHRTLTLNLQVERTEQRPPRQEARISTDGSPQESPKKAWATPNTMDTLPPRSEEAMMRHLTTGARAGRTTSGNLREQVVSYSKLSPPHQEGSPKNPPAPQVNYNGKLNPRWAEVLMGLPVGWTMRSCATPWTIAQMNCACSETESSPLPQNERSECSGQGWPTPPASQRGETLEVYFRKSVDRMKQGGAPFAPTLQVSVEASALGIDPLSVVSSVKDQLHRDTEELVALCLGQGD